MKIATAIFLSLLPLLQGAAPANAQPPIDALTIGFPDLVSGRDKSSGVGCAPIKALKPEELDTVWRGRLTDIAMLCSPIKGVDDEPDAGVNATAKVKSGSVHFAGVPVLEIVTYMSWAGEDKMMVLGGRYQDISERLGTLLQQRCVKEWKKAVSPEGWCEMSADPIHGGIFIETGELGGIWLHPDPNNPQQMIYSDAWSE